MKTELIINEHILPVELELGVKGEKGDTGNGISSIAKTGTVGKVDTYTITFTNGNTTTFTVTNGQDGADGNGISTIVKTSTAGLVDTYTITFTNGTTTTFEVTNGADGEDGTDGRGITSVVKTSTSGLTDTYTITFTDGTTTTFNVTNGQSAPVVQVTGQSITDVMSQKAVTDNLDTKANKDGFYHTLGAGVAENLVGKGSVSATYTRRTSGGSADVGSGTASIKSIHGNTIVWNQLVDSTTTSVIVPNNHIYIFIDKDGTPTRATSDGTSFSVTGGDDCVFDITKMFGAGNEPSTVAEFKALFPLNYYAYNSGTLLSFNGTGIKTDGFNQWDEEWETGTINSETGQNSQSTTKARSKNYIPVLPNTTYYFKISINAVVFAYDTQHNYIGEVTIANHLFTTGSNVAYVRFRTVDNGGVMPDNVCINLSWSGVRNGEYESHWDSTLSLPISTYFANGMRSAGSVYDELTPSKAVTRIGAVDLGTLDWERYTSYGTNPIFLAFIPTMLASYNLAMLMGKYTLYGNTIRSDFANNAVNKSYAQNTSNRTILVRDDSYSDVTEFKTAMSGVYLFYELATPTEVAISPELNLYYRVDDFGTENLLPVNDDEPTTSPIKYDVQYSMNAVDTLRNLDKNYQNQSSMDSLLTTLGTATGGTYTKTWDGVNRKYTFSTTATPTDLSAYRTSSAQDIIDSSKADKVLIKTTMDAIATANTQYYLGEQSSVSITLPSTASAGQSIEVVFYSGATATTLSISGTTIGNIITPSANQRVEINMLYDGTYWAILSNTMAVTG